MVDGFPSIGLISNTPEQNRVFRVIGCRSRMGTADWKACPDIGGCEAKKPRQSLRTKSSGTELSIVDSVPDRQPGVDLRRTSPLTSSIFYLELPACVEDGIHHVTEQRFTRIEGQPKSVILNIDCLEPFVVWIVCRVAGVRRTVACHETGCFSQYAIECLATDVQFERSKIVGTESDLVFNPRFAALWTRRSGWQWYQASPDFGSYIYLTLNVVSFHRSIAPFPARILSRNLAMREIRVADFFAELRFIT